MVKYCFPRVMWIKWCSVCRYTASWNYNRYGVYGGEERWRAHGNYAAEITRYGFITKFLEAAANDQHGGGEDLFLSNSFLTISFSEI